MFTLPPHYFQQLNACLQWQTQKLQELESKIGQMQQEIDTLKKQRTVNVEKIEYKFDQLKIEKLDGTLHIGISPDVGKSIEDFTVNGSEVMTTTDDMEAISRIRSRIDQYLDEDGRTLIRGHEGNYRVVLGKEYIDFMIQDMKGQMDKRIEHYWKSVREDPTGKRSKEDVIVDKIKDDIAVAVQQHLKQKKSEGENGT
ncbi:spore gernimation protein GerPC [Paenibacillus mesophilus]|uniref:spore germination protein GerPC n=1 Tax=Paenibacillus mesophilus TaxID=2582849 RepID=UPI00110F1530|nr:spore germination protein GerPC [Paenibacillus mesophilus]TMV50166.1 spore gernimation protein GerPC [Paenibacillus mesophilus]